MHSGEIVQADMGSTASSYQPASPIDAAEARRIAEDAALRYAPHIDGLVMYDERIESASGESGGDSGYVITWSRQDDETGVLLPTWVYAGVNLETGLLFTFAQGHRDYHGPTEAEIPEQQAIDIAVAFAEQQMQPALDGEVVLVELRGTVIPAGARALGDPPEDVHRLVWHVYLEGAPMTPIDAITGEPVR